MKRRHILVEGLYRPRLRPDANPDLNPRPLTNASPQVRANSLSAFRGLPLSGPIYALTTTEPVTVPIDPVLYLDDENAA